MGGSGNGVEEEGRERGGRFATLLGLGIGWGINKGGNGFGGFGRGGPDTNRGGIGLSDPKRR